jgi:hypothetical protein
MLTAGRMGSYLTASGGDLPTALALYEWNTRASGAVMQTVAMAEVLIRNALDRELTAWASARSTVLAWFDLAPLDSRGAADIASARRRATNNGRRPQDHGKIVSELSFGFWRYLVASRYLTTLWLPALARAFPDGDPNVTARRSQVERLMGDVGFLRNRAAHHRPLHRRDLGRDYRAVVTLCGWLDADAGAWVAVKSTIPATLAERASMGI